MLPVSDISAIVLIEFGSMHSFISKISIDKIGNKCIKMNYILDVGTPSGEVINTYQMVKDVKLEIKGKVLKADLYLLRMKDFDVILGMDWLGRNYTTILCDEKEVLFHKPGDKEFRFFGIRIGTLPRLVPTMKVEKMLRKNACQGFLLNVTSKPQSE